MNTRSASSTGISLKKILVLLLSSIIIAFPALLTVNFGSAATNPSITVSPISGPIGTIVTVTGQNFQSGSTITLIFASQIMQLIKIEANQSFVTKFTVPNITAGIYDVAAESPDNTAVIVLFEVTAEIPTVTFTPSTATPGTIITITGSGFPKTTTTETYEVQIKGRYGFAEYFISGTAKTDSEGKFQYTAPVLDYMGALTAYAYKTPEGSTYTNYNLTVTCPAFTVIPSLTLTPNSAPAGTNITAVGRGFASLSTNRLMWATTQLNVYPNSDTIQDYIQIGMHQFGFSTTFTVPNAQTGTYTIIAQQTYESDPHIAIENGKTAQATFTLTTTGATQTPAPTQTPTTPPTTAPTTAVPTTAPTTTPTPTSPTPTSETTPTPTPEQTQTPQSSPTQTTLHTTSPTATPTPEQSNTTLYLIAGAIATIAVITIALIVIRKRKTTNKTKP